jgi:hypothetical protein
MKNRLIFFLLLSATWMQAQQVVPFKGRIEWDQAPKIHTYSDGTTIEVWRFKNSAFSDETPTLPVFYDHIPLTGRSNITVEIVSANFEPFAKKSSADDAFLSNDLKIEATVDQEGQKFWGSIRFIPVRKSGSGFERLTDFSLNIRVTPITETAATDRGGPQTYNSALSDGSIYKFGVSNTGMYKLDYAFLKNQLGISDLDNIDPRTIRIYGNGGAMMPEKNDDLRPDDLLENAIQVYGESDGKFDNSDYILFYAVGPQPWFYKASSTDPQLTIRKHLYDNNAWYFVKVNTPGNGLRVAEQPSISATAVTESFDDVQRREDELVNLLNEAPSATGSGKRWFGDYFYQTRQRNYDFNFANIVSGSTARIKAEFAGRSAVSQNVRLIADGTTFSRNIASVSVSNNELPYAANASVGGTFSPNDDNINVSIDYPEVSQQSEGWIDYIEVNTRRRLSFVGQSMEFRDLQTMTQDATTFKISGVSGNSIVWDITTPQTPARQQATLGTDNTLSFGATTKNVLRSFVVFTDNGAFPKPEQSVGKIANQNLHGLDELQMAIIYAPEFESMANALAEHRRSYSGLSVTAVNINQVYNEFSSGNKDITAIRDFAKMLYDRQPTRFKYLLLFGDGSFDPKNNSKSDDNKDYIPVYETQESFDPIKAYPSDDYYGLLSPGEGGKFIGGLLDIAVGRIPASSATNAQAVVDKIIAYDNNPATLGDWHLRTLFIADDEDGNPHINQADKLANETGAKEDFFNVEKIYFDAYQQVATSAGQRYPDAKSAINSDVFKGMLIMQYVGHGGPRGWAQERVVDNNDIAGWENPDRFPLIITATCSFGGYDDYTNLTGGEQSLLKINSGAVALFTTVRAVYIDGNERLTDGVQNVLYQRVDGHYRSIGEILQVAKNTPPVSGEDNARRFTLLGDPAMYLALPEYGVKTTAINGKAIEAGKPDTLRALMPVEIEGKVVDSSGNFLPAFNGKVTVAIFDKAQTLQTLGQDAGSDVRPFTLQNNVIFKGSATVTNGVFKIKFIVPKDINYSFGAGKISYYADNGTPLDAAGGDRNIIIGGNANLVKDEQPPIVQPYLNTDAFVFGGITNNDPKILIKCSDDYGMNVTGISLGHDLTAVLDGNVLETIVLNDFYQSAQDDYRKGQAIYPLHNIATGKHTLKVKGWDIANNPGEGYTEFVVAEDGKAALDHVLNYPNPFTTNTYFQFGHNLAGQVLDVQINIFSVSGKLVKSILHTAAADGFRVTDIQWDGRDEYGDALARGVYIYRVKVRGTDIVGTAVTAESDFEKLVILK